MAPYRVELTFIPYYSKEEFFDNRFLSIRALIISDGLVPATRPGRPERALREGESFVAILRFDTLGATRSAAVTRV